MELLLLILSGVLWCVALGLRAGDFKVLCVVAAVCGITLAVRGLRDVGRRGRK